MHEVQLYCLEKALKVLLILDNTFGKPPHLDDIHPSVKVFYVPPNKTLILQPMDQDVIANFKKFYICRQ